MKAVSYAQGKVNFNANAPTPKGDGVLVDIVSAGICGMKSTFITLEHIPLTLQDTK